MKRFSTFLIHSGVSGQEGECHNYHAGQNYRSVLSECSGTTGNGLLPFGWALRIS